MWYAFVVFLVLVLALVGLLAAGIVWALWAVRDTIGRAGSVYARIQPGMNPDQVHDALSKPYIVHYSLVRDGTLTDTDKKAFIDAVGRGSTAGSMSLHMMGSTPYRVSFTVTFDAGGIVREKSSLHGWD